MKIEKMTMGMGDRMGMNIWMEMKMGMEKMTMGMEIGMKMVMKIEKMTKIIINGDGDGDRKDDNGEGDCPGNYNENR